MDIACLGHCEQRIVLCYLDKIFGRFEITIGACSSEQP